MTDTDAIDFTPGRPVALADGVRRVVAPNGGLMTGPGTNTYLIGRERLVIVDPGPALDGHLQALVAAVGSAQVTAIAVTHTHLDHSPAASVLAARFGVELHGRRARHPLYQDPTFAPARETPDGAALATDLGPLVAVATPGHASNHLCWHVSSMRWLCTGDHILGTVSPVIVHPDGSLLEYLDSLRRVQALAPSQLLPGHGPPVRDPDRTIERLIAHRMEREQRVLEALARVPGGEFSALLAAVYAEVPLALHAMAAHTLEAHLVKLQAQGRVHRRGDAWALC